MPIFYGDRIANGQYHLHSRFDHVANFVGTAGMVSLVDSFVGAGPSYITIDRDLIQSIDVIDVHWPGLSIDDHPIDVSSWCRYESRVDPSPDHAPHLLLNLPEFIACLKRHAPDPSISSRVIFHTQKPQLMPTMDSMFTRLRQGISSLREGSLQSGLRLLSGCGPGLTPSGDDFIAGWLVGLHSSVSLFGYCHASTIQSIRSNISSGNPIVENLIACSSEGAVSQPMRSLLTALCSIDIAAIEPAVARVCRCGASSGADYLAGFLFAFDQEIFNAFDSFD